MAFLRRVEQKPAPAPAIVKVNDRRIQVVFFRAAWYNGAVTAAGKRLNLFLRFFQDFIQQARGWAGKMLSKEGCRRYCLQSHIPLAVQSVIRVEKNRLEQLRLDKVIAAQGQYSRRDVKRLVSGGAVTVNGKVATKSDQKIDMDLDQVCINGKMLALRAHVYIMLNKPQGVVSASRDTREKTVVDLVEPSLRRKGLFPAGRLDKDTTGFVLITDDGELAHRILSPKNHVPKTYIAVLDQEVTQQHIQQFLQGVTLDGGERCKPALLSREPGYPQQPAVRIVLREGMYHQIKRMFSSVGIQVLSLCRIAMGGVPLDSSLLPGKSRELTPQELQTLRSAQPLELPLEEN